MALDEAGIGREDAHELREALAPSSEVDKAGIEREDAHELWVALAPSSEAASSSGTSIRGDV